MRILAHPPLCFIKYMECMFVEYITQLNQSFENVKYPWRINDLYSAYHIDCLFSICIYRTFRGAREN